jgi:hypothetical protein
MHCPDHIVRFRREKAKERVLALDGIGFGAATPVQAVQIPAKKASGRSSENANHVGVFFGFVSAYSQKLVKPVNTR